MRRRVTVFAALTLIVGLAFMQLPASAGHGDISVPIDTVVNADQGEVVELASITVDPELVGTSCDWEFHATNQESANPGNDLILSTGGVDTVIPGVEDIPNQILDVTGSGSLGETLTVSVRLGPNEVFSAGLSVELVCDAEEPSTTSTTEPEATTTTAPAPAEADATTTTAPSPTTSTPTPTTVDTEVEGQVEPGPTLAVTGPSSATGPLIGLAAILLLAGVGILSLRARVRS